MPPPPPTPPRHGHPPPNGGAEFPPPDPVLSRKLVTASALRALFLSSAESSEEARSRPNSTVSAPVTVSEGRNRSSAGTADAAVTLRSSGTSSIRTGQRVRLRNRWSWKRWIHGSLYPAISFLCLPCLPCAFVFYRRRKAASDNAATSPVIEPNRRLGDESSLVVSPFESVDSFVKRELLSRFGLATKTDASVQPPQSTESEQPKNSHESLTIHNIKCRNAPFLPIFYELFNYRALLDGDTGIHDLLKSNWTRTDTEKVWDTLDPWSLIAKAKRYQIVGYIALTPGTASSTGRFILEPGNKRLWHQDATWNMIVRGVNPICDLVPFNDNLFGGTDAGGHRHWKPFIVLVLNRMLVISAGLQGETHDSVRGTIAIQVVREMIMWRFIMRNAAWVAGAASVADIPSFGLFRATDEGRISINGRESGDVDDLNPCSWRTAKDIANGLLAWTTIKVNGIADAHTLLRANDYSIRGVARWCTACLQFSAGRDFATAEAFVGLLRFMFVRQWLPPDDMAKVHLCANEFLHRAVAVPELEACLPELLGVEGKYRAGHDIDTGAVTVFDKAGANNSNDLPQEIRREITARGVSPPRLPRARSTRVVMSVQTRPPSGKEWQVPRVVPARIKFQMSEREYQLCVAGQSVECRKIGACAWLKRNARRITGVQAMGVGINREPNGVDEPEASGATAISNALAGAYGEDVCLHMLAWLHRGIVQLSENCTAARFLPKSSLRGDMAENQTLDFTICRRMVYGRRGHELYWLPGEGLSCFRVRDSANGTYKLSEIGALPDGVEVCAAEISMNFG